MLYTKYIIYKNVIKNLDDKYKNNINSDSKKLFFYANAFDYLRYYRLNKFKEFDYDVYNKVSKYKKDLLLLNYIKVCQENKFYKPNITFLYGLAISYAVDLVLEKYDIKVSDYILLDKYLNKNIKLNNSYIKKHFSNSLLISFTELDFFKEGIVRTYSTVYTHTYIEESIKVLNKTFLNPLYRFKEIIISPFKNKQSRITEFSYNKNLNNKFITYFKRKIVSSEGIKDEMCSIAIDLISCVNQALYFDRQSDLVEFATANGWHDIIDYYSYIKKRQQEEKERQLFYKIKQKSKIIKKRRE